MIVERSEEIRWWVRLLLPFAAIFALFHFLAAALGSDRGQSGVAVGVVVVAAILVAELFLFGGPLLSAALSVGLGRPAMRGILAAVVVSILLLGSIPVFASSTGTSFEFYPNWLWLLPGLFFQGGIAEETLFRGYLFGHIREGRTYWRAAVLAALPFIAVHLFLFFTMPWPIAAASVGLAVVTSFPFSRLYELGGNTIWPPAIVHFTMQAGVKTITTTGDAGMIFPLIWIVASAFIPLLVYVIPLGRPDPRAMDARR